MDVSFTSSTDIVHGIFLKNSGTIGSAARFYNGGDTSSLTDVLFLYNVGLGSVCYSFRSEIHSYIIYSIAFVSFGFCS